MYPKKKSIAAAEKLDTHTETSCQSTSQPNPHPQKLQSKLTNLNNTISVNLTGTNCDSNIPLVPPYSRHQYHQHTNSSIGVGSYHSCWSVPISPLTGSGVRANNAGCGTASIPNPPNCAMDGIALGGCGRSLGGAEALGVDTGFTNSHYAMPPNGSVASASHPLPPPSYYNNPVSGGVNTNGFYGSDAGQPQGCAGGSEVLPLPPQSPILVNTSLSSHSGAGRFSPGPPPPPWNSQIQQAEARYKHLYEEFRKLSRSRSELVENLARVCREQQALQQEFDFYRTKASALETEKAEVMKAYASDITLLLVILDRLTGELAGLRRSTLLPGDEVERQTTLEVSQAGGEAISGINCNLYVEAGKKAQVDDVNCSMPIAGDRDAMADSERSIARQLCSKFGELERVLQQLEEDMAKESSTIQKKMDLEGAQANKDDKTESNSISGKGTKRVDNSSYPKGGHRSACPISYSSFRWLLNVLHLCYEQYDSMVSLASLESLQRESKNEKEEKVSSMEKYEGNSANSSNRSIENDKDSCNHSNDITPRSVHDNLLWGNLQNIVAAAHKDIRALFKSLDYGFPLNSSGCCGLKLQLQLPQSPSNVPLQLYLENSKNTRTNVYKSNQARLNLESLSEGEVVPNNSLYNNQSGPIFPVLETTQCDAVSEKIDLGTVVKVAVGTNKDRKS